MKQRLSDSLDDFRLYRTSQGKSKSTIRNDQQVLVALLTHVGNIYTENINDRHLDEFLAKQSETRSAKSLGIDHAVLSQFFKWARRTRRLRPHDDPMAGRRPPKAVDRERGRVHVSKFPYLLDAAEKRHPRDRAFVALCLYTLSRTSEVAAMRVGDVDLDAGYIRTKVFKSHKEDRVPITKEMDRELRKWMTTYAEMAGPLQPSWFLTPARKIILDKGNHMRFGATALVPDAKVNATARDIVKPALAAIGFTLEDRDNLNGEGAHTLRRSGARALFDALSAKGYDYALRVTQSLLHHKNLALTEHYIGISADRRERDKLLKGQSVFETTAEANVVQLREAK